MKLIAYVRVSSSGQLDAYGPAAQLGDIRRWAKAHHHKIVDVKTDDISGKAEAQDRPALLECLQMLRKPPQADGLVVANLTRLARELHVQEAILAQVWAEDRHVFAADQGEILQNDPDDPMRTAMRQMQGVFAQLDRAMITKRLRDGRRIKASMGGHAGGVYPFGTHGVSDGRRRDAAPHPDEQAAVELIVAMRGDGASYRSICAALDGQGIRPRRAASWSAMSVRSVALRAGCS
jgi:DNA invertase Pin-like site-specific DNA recombinase